MIRRLRIENFRGLELLELQSPGRFNLILGQNNSGKTTLLEALFLACPPGSPPDVFDALNVQRGCPRHLANESLLNAVFFGLDPTRVVHIECLRDREGQLLLTDPPSTLTTSVLEIQARLGQVHLAEPSALVDSSAFRERTIGLEFKLNENGHQHISTWGTPVSGKRRASRHTPSPPPWRPPAALYSGRRVPSDSEEGQRYRDLSAQGHGDLVLAALSCLEPRLKGVGVESRGGPFTRYADIGLGQQIPYALLGDGMSRAFSLALALESCRGGILLADEIENGLHHLGLAKLWTWLISAALASHVQIFAATHSHDCVRAAFNACAAAGASDDLRVYRLNPPGTPSRLAEYRSSDIEAALSLEWEIR